MGTFRKLKRSVQKNFDNIRESDAIHEDTFENDTLLIFNSNGTHVKCIYKYYDIENYSRNRLCKLYFYLPREDYIALKEGKIPGTLPDKVRSRIKYIVIKDL